ncbi:MAG TPA: hypothetical protein EYG35_00745 [Gammaproteobacteria bacterium]|jgi:hypothetical protein|nr:hypothetical protein [Gammaproteobacteria bacterium]
MNKKITELVLILILSILPVSYADGIEIQNFYTHRWESGDLHNDSTYITIGTDKVTNVKCAIYDGNDKPIRVSVDPVSPPLSEIIILSSQGMIESVKCWDVGTSLY